MIFIRFFYKRFFCEWKAVFTRDVILVRLMTSNSMLPFATIHFKDGSEEGRSTKVRLRTLRKTRKI